jgi:hypothetical protein
MLASELAQYHVVELCDWEESVLVDVGTFLFSLTFIVNLTPGRQIDF